MFWRFAQFSEARAGVMQCNAGRRLELPKRLYQISVNNVSVLYSLVNALMELFYFISSQVQLTEVAILNVQGLERQQVNGYQLVLGLVAE